MIAGDLSRWSDDSRIPHSFVQTDRVHFSLTDLWIKPVKCWFGCALVIANQNRLLEIPLNFNWGWLLWYYSTDSLNSVFESISRNTWWCDKLDTINKSSKRKNELQIPVRDCLQFAINFVSKKYILRWSLKWRPRVHRCRYLQTWLSSRPPPRVGQQHTCAGGIWKKLELAYLMQVNCFFETKL